MEKKAKKIQNRDVQDVLDLIAGKWRGAILASLCDKPKRFNELKRDLGNITPHTLTTELKYLELNKIIEKEITTTTTILALYCLTAHGSSLIPLVMQMAAWGQKHREMIMGKRQNNAVSFLKI